MLDDIIQSVKPINRSRLKLISKMAAKVQNVITYFKKAI